MTHDDELRSRMARLGEAHELGELSADDVVARGRRGAVRHRVLAVAAVLLLAVGVAGVIRLTTDDGTTTADVASGADDPEVTASTVATTSTVVSAGTDPAPSSETAAVAMSYGGGDWILPWGQGFVSFGQVFEPSDATMQDLVPDIADRLPVEVVEALGDITEIDEAVARLEEVGLLDEATAAVTGDPELLEAYTRVMAGGTYRSEASVSADGMSWTVLDDFALPGGSDHPGLARSDGAHLVVVEQLWQEDGTSGSIVVSTTDDLVGWTSVTVPFELPDRPGFVRTDAYPDSLALGADGWYLTVSSSSWIDLWSLVPPGIQAEFEGDNSWWPEAEGLRIEAYDYENGDETPIDTRIVPWSDLGISYADYQRYGEGESGNTAAFAGSWDGSIATATPPTDTGCCAVIGTDAGFIAQSWGWEEISPSSTPSNPTFYFSADGNDWVEIEGPPDAEWINGLVAVDGGVITADGAGSVWRGAADGTGWTSVDIPGLPTGARLWFGSQSGRGAATLIDTATHDNAYEQVPYVTIIEQDGYEIRSDSAADGSVTVVVTEIATGNVVIDEVIDPLLSAMPEFISYGTDEGNSVAFLDPEGEIIVAVSMETFDAATSTAIAEAQEALGWVEPDYDYSPDFWLVATVDGLTWLVEDLGDETEEDGYGAAAVNGDTVVVRRWGGGWETFTIG